MEKSSDSNTKTFSKKQQYAIAKSKEEQRRCGMCVAEDKGMGVKFVRSFFWEEFDENNQPFDPPKLELKPFLKHTRPNETPYIKQLKDIGFSYPTYKQCCTGLSSLVRDSIVVDVDDDYHIAEKRLAEIIKLSNGIFPEPNYRIINTKTNHIQYMFILRNSIFYHKEESKVDYQNVTRLMNAVLGGDLNFKFYQCKNPYSNNPALKTTFNLPETLEGYLTFEDFMKTAEWIENNIDKSLLEDEIQYLIQQAVQMNKKKKDKVFNPKQNTSSSIDKVSKNLDKIHRNENYKKNSEEFPNIEKSSAENSRNVLAKDYARLFVWHCLSNDIEVDIKTVVSYLVSKSEEISQKVGKDELLSMQEIRSTAKCTYYWCIANFDKDKAKFGSFSEQQRRNSLYVRQNKAYFKAKDCVALYKKGYKISRIAEILNVTPKTAGIYLKNFEKLFKKHTQIRKIQKEFEKAQKQRRKKREFLRYLNDYLASPRTSKPEPPNSFLCNELSPKSLCYKYLNIYIYINIYILIINNILKVGELFFIFHYNNKSPLLTIGRAYKATSPI